jgi:hypothetical protein
MNKGLCVFLLCATVMRPECLIEQNLRIYGQDGQAVLSNLHVLDATYHALRLFAEIARRRQNNTEISVNQSNATLR